MDGELLKAVKAANDEWFSDGSSIHLPRMLKHMDWQRHALSATVAEYRKRRAESPWKGPFKSRDGAVWNTTGGGLLFGSPVFCDSIASALNVYYGYDAQGNDVLEGL